MSFDQVKPGLYQLVYKGVNVFLVDCFGLTLVDTGTPEMGPMIVKALRDLGHDPRAVNKILLTHAHYDHAGAASFLQTELQAEIFCHPLEAELLKSGETIRAGFHPSPGLLNRLLYETFIRNNPTTVPPVQVDVLLEDEEEAIGGLQAIHTPGHALGHLAFLWKDTLIAGDAASNVGWLRAAIGTEDYPTALQSIQKLCSFDFETACFGHGPPITTGADKRFRARRWAAQPERELLRNN